MTTLLLGGASVTTGPDGNFNVGIASSQEADDLFYEVLNGQEGCYGPKNITGYGVANYINFPDTSTCKDLGDNTWAIEISSGDGTVINTFDFTYDATNLVRPYVPITIVCDSDSCRCYDAFTQLDCTEPWCYNRSIKVNHGWFIDSGDSRNRVFLCLLIKYSIKRKVTRSELLCGRRLAQSPTRRL